MKIPSLIKLMEELEEASIPKPLHSYKHDPVKCLRLLLCWWKDGELPPEVEQ